MTIKHYFMTVKHCGVNTLLAMTLLLFASLASPPSILSAGNLHGAELLTQIQDIIDKYYGGPQITNEQLLEGAATGMVDMLNIQEVEQRKNLLKAGTSTDSELRDHTFNQLLTPSSYKLMKESIAGKFAGIGAIIKKDPTDKAITVTRLLEGSSALEAGLKDNDQITEIDSISVEKLSLKDCVTKLRGVTDSKLQLKVLREVGKETIYLEFTVTRRPVTIPDVENKIYDNQYGYILIRSFSDSTSILLTRAIRTIRKAGINKLILDLRDNPGGEFTSAIKAADLFLPKDTVIVTTTQKYKTRIWKAQREKFWNGALVCLINDRTASAAEILAGAIKSSSSGILAGQPTFGKDSVQTVFRMPDNYGLKLTTSRLILEGLSQNDNRIHPDIFLEKREDDNLVTSFKPAIKVETMSPESTDSETVTDDTIKSACGMLKHMKGN